MRAVRAKMLRKVAKSLSPTGWKPIYKQLKKFDKRLNHKDKEVIRATEISPTLS